MGSRTQVKKVAVGDLYIDALPPETQEAFRKAVNFSFLDNNGWYLAGGTALALQVGHRESLDLDFFIEGKTFDTEALERALTVADDWKTTDEAAGTLYGLLCGAKVSFIAYPFFRPSRAHVQCGAIRILLPDHIAAMKIIAVSQRGRKRDFVDLYWFSAVHGSSLLGVIERAVAQYPEQEHSSPHFIKSLTYFDDAEGDPMPDLNFKADWEGVKAYFRREVPPLAKKLLRLQ